MLKITSSCYSEQDELVLSKYIPPKLWSTIMSPFKRATNHMAHIVSQFFSQRPSKLCVKHGLYRTREIVSVPYFQTHSIWLHINAYCSATLISQKTARVQTMFRCHLPPRSMVSANLKYNTPQVCCHLE